MLKIYASLPLFVLFYVLFGNMGLIAICVLTALSFYYDNRPKTRTIKRTIIKPFTD